MLGLSARFEQDPNGLTAQQVMQRWVVEHRFLPSATREPDVLLALIIQFVREQHKAGLEAPKCPVHRIEMVLLGTVGTGWYRSKRPLSIHEIFGLGKRGFRIRNGIFRCPTPCCYYVESPNAAA